MARFPNDSPRLTAPITVTLSAASGFAITVDYTAGAATGGVTFAPGVTLRTFAVPVINDNRDEPNEAIRLTLINPVNATLAPPTVATLTVVDDDAPPTVRMSNSSYSVRENAGSAPITVTLSAASGFTVTVNYAAGAATGRVTFPPGVTLRTFAVAVINDSLVACSRHGGIITLLVRPLTGNSHSKYIVRMIRTTVNCNADTVVGHMTRR